MTSPGDLPSPDVRPQDETTRALAEYVLADPDRTRAAVESMATLEQRVTYLQTLSAREAAEARALRRKLRDTEARLGRTSSALSTYRRETERLKADLRRLRGSAAWKVGRLATRPLGAARRFVLGKVRPGDRPGRSDAASVGGAPSASSGQGKRWSEMDFDELIQQLHDEPTEAHLGAVLNRAWFVQGEFRRATELAEEFPELVEELDSTGTILVRRLQGMARLAAGSVPIPARSEGVAYLPNPGRTMYCVFSTPVYHSNGYSTRTEGLARGVHTTGGDIVVVARAGYPWSDKAGRSRRQVRTEVVRDGVSYVHHPGPSSAVVALDHWIDVAADAYVREALIQRPSLIQAASNHAVGLAALIAARRLGVPFVYEVRGLWELTEASAKPGWDQTDRFRTDVELETLVCREADRVLAITEEVRQVLIERGVPADRIALLPNAADTDRFWPLPRDHEYAQTIGIRDGATVLGFAGSLAQYEGLDLLVRSVADLNADGCDVQLVIAGSGEDEALLRALVEELDAGEHVKMLGRLDPSEMPRLFSVFDIMPCPRLSQPVTELVSPLKPLEAMASAKAVILSDVQPHRTLAGENGERALSFPAGDVDALSAAIRTLVEDPDRRRALARAGRLWVIDERSWQAIAGRLAGEHTAARAHHRDATTPSTPLERVRVGLIADEFTAETLAASLDVVMLDRQTWRGQLDGLDLVFVESAWEGNNGQWHHGVGYYGDEEFADLAALLAEARARGIGSVFWNKEDPIHTARFLRTAQACDHTFTTDANLLLDYLQAGGRIRTASSLPFYAQPRLHNPLPGRRPLEDTVAYAGTFYGQRYAQRSAELLKILEACAEQGLAIYDRQAEIPDSPYRFPAHLAPLVRGSVPYAEVLDVYRAHLASINVNSVADSPTMYSRRVVEVAACGGAVISGPGRGVRESFGEAVLVTGDELLWRSHLHQWAQRPDLRAGEAWRQMRAVFRSRTVDTALTILMRTAELSVAPPPLATWGAVVPTDAGPDLLASLHDQTWPPAVVTTGDAMDSEAAGWWARVDAPLPSTTWAEDQLWATRYGDWDRLTSEPAGESGEARPYARPGEQVPGGGGLVRADRIGPDGLRAALDAPAAAPLRLVVAQPVAPPEAPPEEPAALAGRTVLVAGHDLKFARQLIEHLEASGAHVLIDQWTAHNQHDEQASLDLLEQADVVFCEWGLGNVAWYSARVAPHQRLVCRVHLQEIDLPYLRRTDHTRVDAWFFVGELIRQAAITSHGVPAERAHVVPNLVDVDGLDLPKEEGADHHLGLVGIVPQRKRLDLALDLLEKLLATDPRYRLFVKGRTAHDYPWMAQRPHELAWFEAQDARVARINASHPDAVVFDPQGDDMADWYRKIGVAVSVSDFESFHLTLADGAASGARPVSLAWDGIDAIYPREWLAADVDALADLVLSPDPGPEAHRREARERFDPAVTLARLARLIAG